jgi:hypothetical protein
MAGGFARKTCLTIWGARHYDRTSAPAGTGQDENAPYSFSDYGELVTFAAENLAHAPAAAALAHTLTPGYIAAVPEPGTITLLIAGAGVVVFRACGRRQARNPADPRRQSLAA